MPATNCYLRQANCCKTPAFVGLTILLPIVQETRASPQKAVNIIQ